MKTRTSKAMGVAAAFAAIVASVPLAINAYAEPEPAPQPGVEIPDPQGNCDPFKAGGAELEGAERRAGQQGAGQHPGRQRSTRRSPVASIPG